MRRSSKLKAVLVRQLKESFPVMFDVIAQGVARLPVAQKDSAKKRALIAELKALDRQQQAAERQAKRVLADRLDRLPIEKRLV